MSDPIDYDDWQGYDHPARYSRAYDDGDDGDDYYDDEWYEDYPDYYPDIEVAADNTFWQIWKLDRPDWRVKLLLTRYRLRYLLNKYFWRAKWWVGRQIDRLRGRPCDRNGIPF